VSSPSGVRGEAPAANAFWAYFRASESFLVETMHYGTNPKFGAGLGKIWGPVPPWPQPKTATEHRSVGVVFIGAAVY